MDVCGESTRKWLIKHNHADIIIGGKALVQHAPERTGSIDKLVFQMEPGNIPSRNTQSAGSMHGL